MFRASLLTGRYQSRSGIWPGVLLPSHTGGLPLNETTIAELLKTQGYATGIVGKWHLGVGKDNIYLPPNHGFDSYFGVPYSHDMCPCTTCFYPNTHCWNSCDPTYTKCPLYENTTIVEQPVDLLSLDERYAQHAKDWISEKAAGKSPFFMYLSFQVICRKIYFHGNCSNVKGALCNITDTTWMTLIENNGNMWCDQAKLVGTR